MERHLIRIGVGSIGVLLLYGAFLVHRELYVPTLRALGVLFLAILGAILFHEAVHMEPPL